MEKIKEPDTERVCPRCGGTFKFDLSDLRIVSGRRIIAHQEVHCPFCKLAINPWERK